MSLFESGLPTPNTDTTATAPATVPAPTNGYIVLPITSDPEQLTADAFAYIAQQSQGWMPHEGHMEAWLIEAVARIVSSYAATAAQVPVAIFEFFGGLVGIPPINGAAAEAPTTWTMVDNAGYTIPAGTTVGYATSTNTLTYFTVVDTVVVPGGSTETASGGVTIQAVTVGAGENGLPAGDLVVVDSLPFVTSVVSTAATSGGADAETTAQYINRLSGELQLLSPRPILPADFAQLALNVAGVYRAVAVDGFNPYANILTANDASGEGGVGSWSGATNCTVGSATSWSADGTHSISISSTAAGTMTATTSTYPVSPGQTYSAMLLSHAAVTAQQVKAQLAWYDINGTFISNSAGTGVTDSTSGGVQAKVTGVTAPSNAATAKLQAVYTTTSAASEVHNIDENGLFLGSVTTWSAGGQQTGQQRMVTVVPVDVNGNALTGTEMTAVQSYLAAKREGNVVVNVVPPTYTAVSVVAQVVAQPSQSTTAVQTAVQTALTNYLSPGLWAGGGETPPEWLADNVVHYLSVAGVIMGAVGVQSITTLTINGGTSDVTMAGAAPLPQPTISVTATPGTPGT